MRLIDSDEVKETARRIAKIPWGDDRGHKVEMRWTLEELERLIDTAPTIYAGWIPCSERLPSAEDCPMDCMVTRQSKYVGYYTDIAVAEADGTWTHEDWKAIAIKGRATCISTKDADIIAWMPLPKPYEKGAEE